MWYKNNNIPIVKMFVFSNVEVSGILLEAGLLGKTGEELDLI